MGVGSYGVCFGGIEEGYPLVELIGVDDGSEIGSFIRISDGNRYGKLEGYPLGEWEFCQEEMIEVSYSVDISNGSK